MVVAPWNGWRVLLWAGTAGREIAGKWHEGQGADARVREGETTNRGPRLERQQAGEGKNFMRCHRNSAHQKLLLRIGTRQQKVKRNPKFCFCSPPNSIAVECEVNFANCWIRG